jgi:hypothetical protein
MGTNYYWYEKPNCDCCGRGYEPIHIGKSSGGWCFSLHIVPEMNINTLEDWKFAWVKDGSWIEDEYNKIISPFEMRSIITERSWNPKKLPDDLWYEECCAEPGPNGLARHKIDGRICVGHGEGTWDYLQGEFS